MVITVPCSVCGVIIIVTSLKERYCGIACEGLQARRDKADKADRPLSDPERFALNPVQKAAQKKLLRRKRHH